MTNVEQSASWSDTTQRDWFAEAERIAEAQGRDLPVLASYMDPDPDKFMTWTHEPCARTHQPGTVCILTNGHPERLGTEEREGLGALLDRLLSEHWPNCGVNPWYLADLLRDDIHPDPSEPPPSRG